MRDYHNQDDEPSEHHHGKIGDFLLASVFGFVAYKFLDNLSNSNIPIISTVLNPIKLLTMSNNTNADTNSTSTSSDKRLRTLAWGSKVSPDFRTAIFGVGDTLGIDPSWLMAIIDFESGGTFSPSIKNVGSTATGLIQFMASTAIGLGTSVSALASMSAVEQLSYVLKYFAPYANSLSNISDAYMAVLYPAAIGQPGNFVLFKKGQAAYTANARLDSSGKGYITKDDAASPVAIRLTEGLIPPNVWIGIA